jgi:hypothetical protein
MADRKSHTTREASYPKQATPSGKVTVEIKTTPNGTASGLKELDGPRARGGKHD